MNEDYRKSLIETVNHLIMMRHDLFDDAMGIAMNNELKEISEAFEDGDTYEFQIEHLDNSNDVSLQKVVDLIKEIQTTVDFITSVNTIEDSELNQER